MSDIPPVDNTWIIIGIIVSVVGFIAALFVVIWVYTHPVPPGTPCVTTQNCNPTQTCQDGFCISTTCNATSQCQPPTNPNGTGQVCANNFCYQTSCATSADCPSGTVCGRDSRCYPNGSECSTDTDCWATVDNTGPALICVGATSTSRGTCQQCGSNADCRNQNCFGGVCVNSCANVPNACTGDNSCIVNVCCPDTTSGQNCATTNCPSGEFCVNETCTCQPGLNGNTCRANSDCQSNNCLGGVCVVRGGTCSMNNIPGQSQTGMCPTNTPYCVEGQCSQLPYSTTGGTGAACQAFQYTGTEPINPFSACNINAPGFTPPVGISISYCMSGHCTLTPGGIGALCGNDNRNCAPINGVSTCNMGRCA